MITSHSSLWAWQYFYCDQGVQAGSSAAIDAVTPCCTVLDMAYCIELYHSLEELQQLRHGEDWEHLPLRSGCPMVFVLAEPPQSLPFIPFALVTVIFLHMIVAVVYHTKRNKDPARGHYRTADAGGVVSLE
ncbi:hypothetical protein AOLI_G00039200 [Acnodon oligacanthus]